MATTTPNIGLTKPDGTENYDLAVVNTNSDIVDAEITDAKAGSNTRVFKCKNDVTSVDNALNVQGGDGRYLSKNNILNSGGSLILTSTAYNSFNGKQLDGSEWYIGRTNNLNDNLAFVNSVALSDISLYENGGINLNPTGGNKATVVGKEIIVENHKQAIHATDALRISGQTLSLFKGNGSQEDITLPEGGIGYSQTWVDETANRGDGITYTNTTGKPIELQVSVLDGTITVDGLLVVGNGSGGVYDEKGCIIPNGSAYSVSGTIYLWLELK